MLESVMFLSHRILRGNDGETLFWHILANSISNKRPIILFMPILLWLFDFGFAAWLSLWCLLAAVASPLFVWSVFLACRGFVLLWRCIRCHSLRLPRTQFLPTHLGLSDRALHAICLPFSYSVCLLRNACMRQKWRSNACSLNLNVCRIL